jgi:hypothetical protein
MYPNPCDFQIPFSQTLSQSPENAEDPVSHAAPSIMWNQPELSVSFTVSRFVAYQTVECFSEVGSLSPVQNYYTGCSISCGTRTGNIQYYRFIGSSPTRDVSRITVFFQDAPISVGDVIKTEFFTDFTMNTPNLFVPYRKSIERGWYICNETIFEYAQIVDTSSNEVLLSGPLPSWSLQDSFSLRKDPPKNVVVLSREKDEILVSENSAFAHYIFFNGTIYPIYQFKRRTTVTSFTVDSSNPITVGNIIQILPTNYDNVMNLHYPGTSSTQREVCQTDVSLLGCTVPNRILEKGGFLYEHAFIYVELTDEKNYETGSCASNNFIGNYFKMIIPNCYVKDPLSTFINYVSCSDVQTMRFRPTGNFRIRFRFPNTTIVKFKEDDFLSPLAPNDELQTSVLFKVV